LVVVSLVVYFGATAIATTGVVVAVVVLEVREERTVFFGLGSG